MPTHHEPASRQPLNSSGRPAFFTPAHDAWIESRLSLPSGSVSRIYQDDPVCVLAARHAIRQNTPPTFLEILAPFQSAAATSSTPRFQARMQKRNEMEKKVRGEPVMSSGREGRGRRETSTFGIHTNAARKEDFASIPVKDDDKDTTNKKKPQPNSYASLLKNNPFGQYFAATGGLQNKLPIRFTPAIHLTAGVEEDDAAATTIKPTKLSQSKTTPFRRRSQLHAVRFGRTPSPPSDGGYGDWSLGDAHPSGRRMSKDVVWEDVPESEEEEDEVRWGNGSPDVFPTSTARSTMGLGISADAGGEEGRRSTAWTREVSGTTPIYYEEMAGRGNSVGGSPAKKRKGSATGRWW